MKKLAILFETPKIIPASARAPSSPTGMRSLVEEVYEPSLIDHSLFSKLVNSEDLFLVTVRANHLDIYVMWWFLIP